jgi:RNA polymerase sigma-70 factor (ECF subfamily)
MLRETTKWPDATTIGGFVREAQRDAPGALARLLAALRPALVDFFSRRLTSDVAEDLAQSALVRIAGALSRIDPERADAYVSTVARNLLRTAYHKRSIDKQRYAEVDLSDIPLITADVHEGAEYEELLLAVHRVIAAKLPPELAEIVHALMRGETPTEIAERQAVSPVTVRTRLMRARTVLRRELGSHLSDNCSPRESERARSWCVQR